MRLVPDRKSFYSFDGADFVESEAIRRRAEGEDNLDTLSRPSTKPGDKRCSSKPKNFCGRALAITVTLAHFFLVFLFICFYSPPASPPSPKRARVRTLVLEKSSQPKTVSTKKTIAFEETPKPKVTSSSKKEPQKTKSSKPKATSTHRKKLLSLMQESLNTLESNSTSSSARSLPIGELASEQLHFEASFQEELSSYLQQVLKLPHRGTVTLQLTLSKEGNVKRVTILSATNEENRLYIASTLPMLSLPPFGNQFKGEKEHTFSLTLTSLVEKN